MWVCVTDDEAYCSSPELFEELLAFTEKFRYTRFFFVP